MANPTFSIVLPCYSELEPIQSGASGRRHYRAQSVQRTIKSIMNQQSKNWELIIVNDGCIDEVTPDILHKFAGMHESIRVIDNEKNVGRSAARNIGMEHAKGEWICWVDSDDEYVSNYTRELGRAVKEFPEYDIFNFGAILYWPDYHSEMRHAFKPGIEGDGHEWFRSGHINCGSFIFRRSLWNQYQEKYRIPDSASPFQFAADSKIPLKLDPKEDAFKYENTIDPDTAFQDGVMRQGLSLGNPTGDDYAQFYFLTRDNYSMPLDIALYIIYPRTSEDEYTEFGEIFPTEVPT